ncbi:N-acetyltransferase [Micromonospora sp. NPDC048830]|uniref:N-acetyltransferase n=1 Tax=Micromonospora sp. NPDC048830 TaxID=3364257 RepID=UPI0037191619
MKLMDTDVRRATGEDVAALSAVIADALAVGRLGAWLVPDVAERPGIVRRYAQFALRRGLAHGQVDTTDDRSAVTVWYPRLEPAAPAAAWMYDLHSLLGPHAARFALLHAYVDAVLPHTPHHYLAHAAFRPGQGEAGRALLASHHRVLEADGLPSYAEVCSDHPRDGLLARLGYQPRSPILLEPGGPALWRMWRPPSGSGQPGELPCRVPLHRTATPLRGRIISATPPRFP